MADGGRHAGVRTLLAALTGLSLVATLVGGLLIGLTWGSAALAAESPAADSAADPAQLSDQAPGTAGFASCLAANPRLLVQYLVDESASLKTTDPENQRVEAVQTTLALLANLPEATGTELQVEVSIATFGEEYTTVADWQELTPSTLEGLQDDAASLADRNSALDTDYLLGLDGANQSVAQASAAATTDGEAPPCKLVFWFTDGQYDIEERGTITKPYGTGTAAELEQQGRDMLCRPGGVVDDLRRSQVFLSAVALTSDLEPADQAFVESIALGSAGGQSCGTVPVPANWITGSYVPVEDADQLVLDIIEQVLCALGSCTPVEAPRDVAICPGEACPEGTYTFPVDPGIVGFDVLVVGDRSDFGISVLAPGESGALPVPSGEGVSESYGGADITATWLSPTSAVVHADVLEGAAVGDWRVSLVSGGETGARGTIQVFVFGGLEPQLVGEPTLRVGQSTEVTAQVVDRDGEPADLTVYEQTRVSGTLVDPVSGQRFPVQFTEGEDGSFTADVTVAPGVESSTNRLTITVEAVTASGLALEPVSRTVSVPVLPPLVYPQVEPTALQMSSVEGTDPSTGTLMLTAGTASGGCVWVSEAGFAQAPEAAGPVAVAIEPASSSAQDCVRVEAGQSVTLDVTATPQDEANGSVQGAVTLGLSSDAEEEVQTLVVPASFEMAKPLSVATAGVVGLLLVLLAVVLPFLVMWLLKWLTSGFVQTNHLQYAAIEVAVRDGSVVRRSPYPRAATGGPSAGGTSPADGSGPLLVQGDFKYFSSEEGRVRKLTVDGLKLYARSPFYKPFHASEARAAAPGSVVIGGGSDANTAADGSSTQIDQSLSRVWVLAVPEGSLGTLAESTGTAGAGASSASGATGSVPSAPAAGAGSPFGHASGSGRGFGSSQPGGGTATLPPAAAGTLYVFTTSRDVGEPQHLAKLVEQIGRWRFRDDLERIVESHAGKSGSATPDTSTGRGKPQRGRRTSRSERGDEANGGSGAPPPAGSGRSFTDSSRPPFGQGGSPFGSSGDSPFGSGSSPSGGGSSTGRGDDPDANPFGSSGKR